MSDKEKEKGLAVSEDKDVIDSYKKIKEEFKDLEREERRLKDYLNLNVFDYVKNEQYIEDIFAINNSSVAFLERDQETNRINPNIPIIEINGLTKFYASRKIPSLVNVNLRVYLGDVHVVVGPVGSGKTTLFNCLRGIEDYEGEVLIEGKELQTHISFYSDKLVSFITHEFGWDAYATVEDVITERFQELNMTEVETQNYLRNSLLQMNLSYVRHMNIIDLTLLEKRKVQIVIALITDPHVIVMDDIFADLQHHEKIELLNIFQHLRLENRTLLAFSNTFGEFAKFAGSMTIISEGKVFYSGPSSEFLNAKKLNYSVWTEDNKKAISILVEMGCEFSYLEVNDSIIVYFDSQLNLLKFQQKCGEADLVIGELKLLEARFEDLFPLIKKFGNSVIVKTANTARFFSP